MSRRLTVILALMMAHAGLSHARTCQTLIPRDGVTLEIAGVLHQQAEWGPPNFGEQPETDLHWNAWIIDLATPLAIAGGVNFQGHSWPTVSRIQIKMMHIDASWDRLLLLYVGNLVVVTGKLFGGTVVSDVTPEVLHAEQIRLADHATCRVISGR